MNQPELEQLFRVGLATLLGIAIGIERQWRSRMAGPQTIALVSMGSGCSRFWAYDFPTQVDRDRVAGVLRNGPTCDTLRQDGAFHPVTGVRVERRFPQ